MKIETKPKPISFGCIRCGSRFMALDGLLDHPCSAKKERAKTMNPPRSGPAITYHDAVQRLITFQADLVTAYEIHRFGKVHQAQPGKYHLHVDPGQDFEKILFSLNHYKRGS